ncbi:MAG: hypothetical protein PHG85_06755 [Candidatus Altiarchaeota archaeon]|nr:hypothetical protein [Candidatus Altiarchaeota archaeon]
MDITKALPGVALYLTAFILIPRLIIDKLPPMVTAVFGPLGDFLASLAVMGVILAALSAAKTLAPKGSTAELAALVLSEIANLGVLLFFIGFGSPLSFGRGMRPIAIGQDSVVFYDFGFFALLFTAITALKIAAKMLLFIGKKASGQAGEGALAPQQAR